MEFHSLVSVAVAGGVVPLARRGLVAVEKIRLAQELAWSVGFEEVKGRRLEQIFYGYHEDPAGTVPDYDPPHDAPCPFCGKPIHAGDVRTHSLMYGSASYAKRSYFYRTHRTCAEKDPTHTAMDGFILNMIARNGD